jgi:hypothetical protein
MLPDNARSQSKQIARTPINITEPIQIRVIATLLAVFQPLVKKQGITSDDAMQPYVSDLAPTCPVLWLLPM